MKLKVTPEADSYSLQFPQEALSVKLDGGKNRYRRDVLGAPVTIKPTFILNPTQYDYFMAFYRKESVHGSEAFEMDLIVNETTEATCSVNIVPGSLTLGSQKGLSYTVSCELEVEPPFNEDQDSDDDATISAYNSSIGYTP